MLNMQTEKIIKNPRITEKASMLYEGNIYSFDVAKEANKPEVKKAIKVLYGVEPKKINIVNTAHKKTKLKGRPGKTKKGTKKAYVYLKAGDKIDLI